MPITITSKKVNENSSCRLEFQLLDFDDVGIGASNIDSATMTIYNEYDGTVITESTDVASDFDGSGNFSRILTASSNAIINRVYNHNEFHVCLFEIDVNSVDGTLTLVESVIIQVVNIRNKGTT